MAHMHRSFDRVGIFISSICFVHCLVAPVVIYSIPFLSASFHNPWFHLGLAVLVVPIGMFAFIQGYRAHRKSYVLALGVVGIATITLAAVLPHEAIHRYGHSTLNIIGSLFLIAGHYLNRKSCGC